ncbi:MAG TPA: entericidin A/B family lipoprotein [Acetobacteraceae bacterium]|nr:entericidin A/B family lipoprotein [Acetobacteraceae bacterium]
MRTVSAMLLTVFVLAGASLVSACNTTAGLGEDVSATGHAVTHGAEKVQQHM